MNHQKETATPAVSIARGAGLRCGGFVLLAALSVPGFAQAQSAAPAPPSDDSLTGKGITLYGIVDIGIKTSPMALPSATISSAAVRRSFRRTATTR